MEQAKKRLNPLTLILILSGGFFLIFLVISGVMFMRSPGTPRGSSSSSSLFSSGGVGVVELSGVIMDSKKTLRILERFEEEDQVKAVVLRLNSPGGAVAPSQEIYEAVRNFKKPLVVSMSSIAASGAFYVAMGAKKIFANPGTLTGSIGVIMEFANLQKLYDWAKIHRFAIKTGKFKDAGAEYREMTPEEKALLQTMVDDVLVQFKKAISEGRKLPMERVSAIADGRIFSGAQAKALKLVDELGTLQDAVNEAAREAKIKGKPSLIYPEHAHRSRLLDLLLDDSKDESSEAGEGPLERSLAGLIFKLFRGATPSGSESELAPIFNPGIYWLWGAR